jgi:rubrerythrin
LLWLVRATCLVESRADLYSSYVANVLRAAKREEAAEVIVLWGKEEDQHGMVLRQWLGRVDPQFTFDSKDGEYRSSVSYYSHTGSSVRGSVENELLCRCVVEALASAYYRAIKDSAREPVLRDICERLARDEARHYKMFHTLLQQERATERNGFWRNLWVAYRRIRDLENDQIAFAFHCSQLKSAPSYSTRQAALAFIPSIYSLYRASHVSYAVGLILQATGLRVPAWASRLLGHAGIVYLRVRAALLKAEASARKQLSALLTFNRLSLPIVALAIALAPLLLLASIFLVATDSLPVPTAPR